MQHVAPQGVVTVPATAPIQAGSPVYHQGQEIGTALGDAASGDPVAVQLNTPAYPEAEHNVLSQSAYILCADNDLDEYTFDAIIDTTDTLFMMKLPKGFRAYDAILKSADLGTTGDVNVGL